MTYLYAYDIPDNRRRTKVARRLEQFGIRIQKSVFQCDITPELADRLKSILVRYLDDKEDSLFIIPLCEKDLEKTECFGIQMLDRYAEGSYKIL